MNPKDTARINTSLRQERLARGWSQQDLADLLGTTIVTVNRWERGTQQPSPLLRLKLCKLFEKDEEALGLCLQAQPSQGISLEEADGMEQRSFSRSEEPLESPQEQLPLLHQIHDPLFSSQRDMPEASLPLPHTVLSPDPLLPSPVPPGPPTSEPQFLTPLSQRTHRSPKNRLLFTLCLGLLALVCILLLVNASWIFHRSAFSLLQASRISTVVSSNSTLLPTLVPGRLLYQASWEKDRGGWLASAHWHWSDEEGGIILTDSMTNSLMLAPYHLSAPAYAIEATIQRLSYVDLDGNAYGLVIKKNSQQGMVCGVGIHEKPEHFFIGQLAPPIGQSQPHIADDVFRAPAVLDRNWHVYRVEVTPTHIRMFFDGIFMGEATNELHIQEGQIGIYAVGVFLRIKHFMVFAL